MRLSNLRPVGTATKKLGYFSHIDGGCSSKRQGNRAAASEEWLESAAPWEVEAGADVT